MKVETNMLKREFEALICTLSIGLEYTSSVHHADGSVALRKLLKSNLKAVSREALAKASGVLNPKEMAEICGP